MVTMSQKEFQRVKVIEECGGGGDRGRQPPPPAATEPTPGAAPQTALSARFPRLGTAWQSRTLHALGGFYSPEAVDLEPGPRQVPGLQRFPSGGKTSDRGEPRDQPLGAPGSRPGFGR